MARAERHFVGTPRQAVGLSDDDHRSSSHQSGEGGRVRRDASTSLMMPIVLPSGSSTSAYRAPQKAS